jgi:hypothetical protein
MFEMDDFETETESKLFKNVHISPGEERLVELSLFPLVLAESMIDSAVDPKFCTNLLGKEEKCKESVQ